MTTIFDVAGTVQQVCQARDWPFCFIGGLAVQRWAEPRATADVDVTVMTGFGGEDPIIRVLLDHFEGRVPHPAAFARQNRVLLLRDDSGIGIDVSLGALPYEERVIDRASEHELVEGQPLTLCSAEDLVVLKAFAGRHIDWADVERIASRMEGRLDVDLILDELAPLLEVKGALGDLEQVRGLLER